MSLEIGVALGGFRLEDILEVLPCATVRNKAITVVFACLLGRILQFMMVVAESALAFVLEGGLSLLGHDAQTFLVLGSRAIGGGETFTIIFFCPLRKQRVFII